MTEFLFFTKFKNFARGKSCDFQKLENSRAKKSKILPKNPDFFNEKSMKIENLDFFENQFSLIFHWKFPEFSDGILNIFALEKKVTTFASIKNFELGKKQKFRQQMKFNPQNRKICANAMRESF